MEKEVVEKGFIEEKEIILIKRIIFILVVSVVLILLGSVSYYVYNKYLYNPVLLAPGDIVNVYVVDEVMSGSLISDVVSFEGDFYSMQETQIPSMTKPQGSPMPFLIRNEGTVNADVSIVSTETPLFSDSGSLFKFKIHNNKFFDVTVGSGYEEAARDCFDFTGPICFESTPCSGWCDVPYDPDTGDEFDFFITAIYKLEPYDIGEGGDGDEAIIEIRVQPDANEVREDKATTVLIKGVESDP